MTNSKSRHEEASEDPAPFPLGDTLGNGVYRATEKLLKGGSQSLYLGEETARSSQRVLITVIWVPKGISLVELKQSCSPDLPGNFELALVSTFDVRGNDEIRRINQKQYFALVEKLPPGEWLVRLTKDSLLPRKAVELALSVGRILFRAAERRTLLFGVRPEFIWAEQTEDGAIRATGLSDRYRAFFTHTGGGCVVPGMLFQRTYLPPEIHRGHEGSDSSLVFSLSTIIAEWATGKYPFPDSWDKGYKTSLLAGQHIPLDLPPLLAHLLQLGLQADPANRPSLASFLAALEALSPEDLATE